MNYNGGKVGIGKQIADLIQTQEGHIENYVEPFCGMLGVGRHIKADNKLANDSDPATISVLQNLVLGWEPPKEVSEEEYYRVKKEVPETDPLYGFVAFACSFSGKRWGGYARNKTSPRNYALNGYNTLSKLKPMILDFNFTCGDYRRLTIEKNSVLYIDPPYVGTTNVGIKKFNYEEFVKWINSIEAKAIYLSEYTPLENFEVVWEKNINDGLRAKSGKQTKEILMMRKFKS